MTSKTIKAPAITELSSIQQMAVNLKALLEATHAVMPDDKPEQTAPQRHLVGMALVMADELQEWLDGVLIRASKGGSHES